MAEEFKIQPSFIQTNHVPVGFEPKREKESEGFQIDDDPAPNKEPVKPNISEDIDDLDALAVKEDKEVLHVEYFASNTLIINDEDAVSTGLTSYTKLKDITVKLGGSLRVSFEVRQNGNPGQTASARIYVNDVAVGTERTNTTETFAEYTEDISGLDPYDNVQIYGKVTAGNCQVRNFKLLGDRTTGDDYLVN